MININDLLLDILEDIGYIYISFYIKRCLNMSEDVIWFERSNLGGNTIFLHCYSTVYTISAINNEILVQHNHQNSEHLLNLYDKLFKIYDPNLYENLDKYIKENVRRDVASSEVP